MKANCERKIKQHFLEYTQNILNGKLLDFPSLFIFCYITKNRPFLRQEKLNHCQLKE
jgi:hypothetical protein